LREAYQSYFFGYVSSLEISTILSDSLMYCRVDMPEKKRSREDFEAYLKAMLEQEYPKVKYQRPDSWQRRALKESKTS